mmetsp:Transcript_23377/g.73528  ORF Transcript_23377/g.73528 Transcript_23377/m.73528 type:complete len:380 (-) Transcript_23377:1037-2176(-)
MLIAAPRAPHARPLAAPRIVLDVDRPYLPLTERHRCADLVPDRQKDLRLELAHAAEAVVPRTNDGHGKDAIERHRLPPHLKRHDGGVALEHHVDRDGLLGDIGVEREPRAALRRKLDVLQPAAVELLHVRAADRAAKLRPAAVVRQLESGHRLAWGESSKRALRLVDAPPQLKTAAVLLRKHQVPARHLRLRRHWKLVARDVSVPQVAQLDRPAGRQRQEVVQRLLRVRLGGCRRRRRPGRPRSARPWGDRPRHHPGAFRVAAAAAPSLARLGRRRRRRRRQLEIPRRAGPLLVLRGGLSGDRPRGVVRAREAPSPPSALRHALPNWLQVQRAQLLRPLAGGCVGGPRDEEGRREAGRRLELGLVLRFARRPQILLELD